MKTKTTAQIGKEVDKWILAENMPPRPGLKPVRQFDQFHMPMSMAIIGEPDEYPVTDEDEIRAWHDWLNWFTQPKDELLEGIRQPPKGNAFYAFQKAIRGSTRTSPTAKAVYFPTNPPLFVPFIYILRIFKINH